MMSLKTIYNKMGMVKVLIKRLSVLHLKFLKTVLMIMNLILSFLTISLINLGESQGKFGLLMTQLLEFQI